MTEQTDAAEVEALAVLLGAVLDKHVGWQMHRGEMIDDLCSVVADVRAAAEARGAERALREAAEDLAQGRLGIDFAEAAEELDARAAAAGGAR